ncbi:hypothetical protein V6N13_059579 [Hibiscus sabdariffa]
MQLQQKDMISNSTTRIDSNIPATDTVAVSQNPPDYMAMYVRDHRSNICVFVETHISHRQAEHVISSLGFPNSHCVEAHGFSSGIWLCRFDHIHVTVLSCHFQFIHCGISLSVLAESLSPLLFMPVLLGDFVMIYSSTLQGFLLQSLNRGLCLVILILHSLLRIGKVVPLILQINLSRTWFLIVVYMTLVIQVHILLGLAAISQFVWTAILVIPFGLTSIRNIACII